MKLRKHHSLVDDAWFCDCITVRGPGACEEATFFPCYRWVQGQDVLSLPEGTGEGWGRGSRMDTGDLGGSQEGLENSGCSADEVGRRQGSGKSSQSPSDTQSTATEGKKDLESPPPMRGRGLGAAALMENRVEGRSPCGWTSEGSDSQDSTRSRGPLGEDHEPGRESTQTPGRDRAHPDSGPEEEAVRIGHCSRRVLDQHGQGR